MLLLCPPWPPHLVVNSRYKHRLESIDSKAWHEVSRRRWRVIRKVGVSQRSFGVGSFGWIEGKEGVEQLKSRIREGSYIVGERERRHLVPELIALLLLPGKVLCKWQVTITGPSLLGRYTQHLKDFGELLHLSLRLEERLFKEQLGEDASGAPTVKLRRICFRAEKQLWRTVPKCDDIARICLNGVTILAGEAKVAHRDFASV